MLLGFEIFTFSHYILTTVVSGGHYQTENSQYDVHFNFHSLKILHSPKDLKRPWVESCQDPARCCQHLNFDLN